MHNQGSKDTYIIIEGKKLATIALLKKLHDEMRRKESMGKNQKDI